MTQRTPSQTGRYRILGVVGQRANGQVYRARDELLERDVWIKVRSPIADSEGIHQTRFEREARATAP